MALVVQVCWRAAALVVYCADAKSNTFGIVCHCLFYGGVFVQEDQEQHYYVWVRAGRSAPHGRSMPANGSQVSVQQELVESRAMGSADVMEVLSSGEEDKRGTAVLRHGLSLWYQALTGSLVYQVSACLHTRIIILCFR